MIGKRVKPTILSVLEHLREAGVLARMDIKDVLKHSEIEVKTDGSMKITFSKEW